MERRKVLITSSLCFKGEREPCRRKLIIPTKRSLISRAVFLLGATASLLSFAAPNADTANQVVLEISATRERPRNSEGAFWTTAAGRLEFYYSQFYGGENDFSASRIAEIHSDDQGRTWSAATPVLENDPHNVNLMSVSVLRLASGKIAMFYILKRSEIDCRPYLRLSFDEGKSWSEAIVINPAPGAYVEMANDRVIQTWKGRIVVPLASYRVLKPVNDGFTAVDSRGIVIWYTSDDDGTNWIESPTWWTLPSLDSAGKLSVNGLEEPGVVELADGSLFSWARSDQGMQYGFRSMGGGNNGQQIFSAPEPTELKSPFAPANIKRVPNSATLLAVFDDHSGRFPFASDAGDNISGRTPLVAALSEDGGRTWPVRKVLEGNVKGAFSYPSIYFVDGHTVLIAYNAEERYGMASHLGSLRLRRIDLSWLRD